MNNDFTTTIQNISQCWYLKDVLDVATNNQRTDGRFDMDGRHVTVCDSNKPDIGLILSSDSFGCLLDAGDYSLRSIADGKVKRRTTKP